MKQYFLIACLLLAIPGMASAATIGSSLSKGEDGTGIINPSVLGQLAGVAIDLASVRFYGEFVGTVSGTTLTITSVNSGSLGVGTVVFDAAYNQAAIVPGGSGSGGTGTYTLSGTGLSGTLFTSGAVAQERANIANNGTGVWPSGQKISVLGQAGTRNWFVGASASLSHARNVMYLGKTYSLAADSNVFGTTTGAPSNSTGANGDYLVDGNAGLLYGPKASGAWPSGVTLVPTGGPATPQICSGSATIAVAHTGMVIATTAGIALTLPAVPVVGYTVTVKNLTTSGSITVPPPSGVSVDGTVNYVTSIGFGSSIVFTYVSSGIGWAVN